MATSKTWDDFRTRVVRILTRLERNVRYDLGGSFEEAHADRTQLIRTFESWFGEGSREARFVRSIGTGGAADTVREAFLSLTIEVRHLLDDIEAGWTVGHDEAVRTRTHGSHLELASNLLEGDGNQKMAACMVAGVVLENHLRNLCEKHDAKVNKPRKGGPGINEYNQALYKHKPNPVYGKVQMGPVEAWGKMRNATSHHDEDQFEPSQV